MDYPSCRQGGARGGTGGQEGKIVTRVEVPGRETAQASQMPALEGLRLHRVVVVIPAYNEGRFIGSVVVKLLQYPVTVIVVDDGSSDDTAWVAEAARALVVRHSQNKGKGEALNTGFCKARTLDPEAIVVIDGDGQHLPEQLQPVITAHAGDAQLLDDLRGA